MFTAAWYRTWSPVRPVVPRPPFSPRRPGRPSARPGGEPRRRSPASPVRCATESTSRFAGSAPAGTPLPDGTTRPAPSSAPIPPRVRPHLSVPRSLQRVAHLPRPRPPWVRLEHEELPDPDPLIGLPLGVVHRNILPSATTLGTSRKRCRRLQRSSTTALAAGGCGSRKWPSESGDARGLTTRSRGTGSATGKGRARCSILPFLAMRAQRERPSRAG